MLMTKCRGMVSQAEEVMLLMLENPEIDYYNDWKMITLFVGGNDLCQFCTPGLQVIFSNTSIAQTLYVRLFPLVKPALTRFT